MFKHLYLAKISCLETPLAHDSLKSRPLPWGSHHFPSPAHQQASSPPRVPCVPTSLLPKGHQSTSQSQPLPHWTVAAFIVPDQNSPSHRHIHMASINVLHVTVFKTWPPEQLSFRWTDIRISDYKSVVANPGSYAPLLSPTKSATLLQLACLW